MKLSLFAIVWSALVPAAVVICCGRVEGTPSASTVDAGLDSQDTDAGATTPETSTSRSPCSTGAPYETTADLPFVDGGDGAAEPTCIPRCGAVRGSPDPVFDIDALPRGKCEVEGEVCRLGAREKCPPPNTSRGPLTSFRCWCADGAWACGVLARGAGGCVGPRDQ